MTTRRLHQQGEGAQASPAQDRCPLKALSPGAAMAISAGERCPARPRRSPAGSSPQPSDSGLTMLVTMTATPMATAMALQMVLSRLLFTEFLLGSICHKHTPGKTKNSPSPGESCPGQVDRPCHCEEAKRSGCERSNPLIGRLPPRSGHGVVFLIPISTQFVDHFWGSGHSPNTFSGRCWHWCCRWCWCKSTSKSISRRR